MDEQNQNIENSTETSAPSVENKVEPAPVTQPTQPTQPTFKIPDEYKDRAWVSKVKNENDLWKQLDNTQSLLGKKVVVPDFSTAKPEEIDAYLNQLRPKEPKDYEIDLPDEDKELYSKMFYEAGLNQHQAKKFIETYKQQEQQVINQHYNDEQREALLKQELGENYKQVTDNISKVLLENLPPEDLDLLNKLPNKMQVALVKVLNKFGAKSQIGSQGFVPNSGNAVDPKNAFFNMQKELEALQKRPHTMEEKELIINKYK